MTHIRKPLINKAIAESIRTGKERPLWDDNPRGLFLRIKPSGVATFFVQYRSPLTFKKLRYLLGRYGPLTLDMARVEARKTLGTVAEGRCPASEKKKAAQVASTAATLSQFCDDYLRDANAGLVTYRGKPKKPRTLYYDIGRIERHIKPTLGAKLVCDITRRDVERAMHDIRLGKTAVDLKTGPYGRARVTGGAGAANRAISLLGPFFHIRLNAEFEPTTQFPGSNGQKQGSASVIYVLRNMLRWAKHSTTWNRKVTTSTQCMPLVFSH
ncbi:MAG: hypothetical protein ACJAU6_003556 [Alphaproteobacteria bacterium]|jgi:hypothetical protein